MIRLILLVALSIASPINGAPPSSTSAAMIVGLGHDGEVSVSLRRPLDDIEVLKQRATAAAGIAVGLLQSSFFCLTEPSLFIIMAV